MSIETRSGDDATLISAIFEKLRISTNELEASCKKWGKKVKSDKCKIIISADADNI